MTEPTWTLHLIPNTHWDREWYMSLERYRYRLVKLMDRLVDLLEREPRFTGFTLDGQYIPVRDYLDVRPEQQDRLAKLVRNGRLVIGPWFTHPLETLACGEALVRNLMLGIRESRALGRSLMIAYIIDQFGHVSQMPQILAGFGIREAVTWRGVKKDMPSAFTWRASDGSEVLLLHSNGGYGHATALPKSLDDFVENVDRTAFQRAGLRKRVQGIIDLRRPKATCEHILALNGVDHSFAQENLPDIVDIINREIPGVRALHSDLDTYVSAIREAHRERRLPYIVHTGELYHSDGSLLEDIHSLRPDLKMANDRVEGLLTRWAEPFAGLAWALGAPYPAALLWRAWDYVLQNQAHDSIACSSADTVYRDVMARYRWAEDIGQEITGERLQILANAVAPDPVAGEIPVVLVNPMAWPRQGVVSIDVEAPNAVGIEQPSLFLDNQAIPCIVEDRTADQRVRYNPFRGHPTVVSIRRWRITFDAGTVPALGYSTLTVRNGATVAPSGVGLARGEAHAEDERLALTVRTNGTFDVLDKATGRIFEELGHFVDDGDEGTGYDFAAPLHQRTICSHAGQVVVSLVHDSPFKAEFRIDRVLELPESLTPDRRRRSERTVPCRISSLLTLVRGSGRLDIQTTVDNAALDHRLRTLFPSGIDARHAFAEQPYDVVQRPITPGAPDGKNKPIWPMQSFVDVNDGKSGLTVATQGIYEYEVRNDRNRTIILTLMRCVDRIDRGTFGPCEEYRIPLAQCLGRTVFRYSLIPHQGGWESALRAAYEFKFPVLALEPRTLEDAMLPGYVPAVAGPLPLAHSFLSAEPAQILVTALKKNETRSSLVVRAVNLSTSSVQGIIRVSVPNRRAAAVHTCNLNEERQTTLAVGADGMIVLPMRAKEIVTLEIELALSLPKGSPH